MAKLPAKAPPGFPPTVVKQLADLEKELGGREQVVGMLTLAPLNPDLRYVLGMLGDPRNQAKTLAEICAHGNILPGELLKHLSSAALLRGKVRAQQKIGDGIAAVAEDVMRRAAPYEGACSGGCQGTGTITPEPTKDQPNPEPEPCETCRGTGRLVYAPDLERQKLAIEMAQLLPKSGGLQILNANVQGGSREGAGMGAIERLQALTDRILYGSGHASGGQEATDGSEVEGEIVPPVGEDGSHEQTSG